MIFQSVFPRNKFKKCSHQAGAFNGFLLGHTQNHYHPIKNCCHYLLTIQAISQLCHLFPVLDFHSSLISLVLISLACTQIFPWFPSPFKWTTHSESRPQLHPLLKMLHLVLTPLTPHIQIILKKYAWLRPESPVETHSGP